MRNKAAFNKDWDRTVKAEIKEEVDCVKMAAHALRHSERNYTQVEPSMTVNGEPARFYFKKILREGTDEVINGLIGDATVEDWEYIGMEEE